MILSFLDKLLNKELAGVKYASNSSLDEDAPPPPPRGSPNFLHMLESQETDPQDHELVWVNEKYKLLIVISDYMPALWFITIRVVHYQHPGFGLKVSVS